MLPVAIALLVQAGAPALISAPIIMPPPPPVIRPMPRVDTRPVVTFQVRVTGGGQQLYSDLMRVGASGANYSQNSRDGAEQACPDGYNVQVRSLNVSISPNYGEDSSIRVSASWKRPQGDGCGMGSRTAEVEQTVSIAPGQTVRVTGDAGLVIELTRR